MLILAWYPVMRLQPDELPSDLYISFDTCLTPVTGRWMRFEPFSLEKKSSVLVRGDVMGYVYMSGSSENKCVTCKLLFPSLFTVQITNRWLFLES